MESQKPQVLRRRPMVFDGSITAALGPRCLASVGRREGKSRKRGRSPAGGCLRAGASRVGSTGVKFLQPLDPDVAERDRVAVAGEAEEASGPFQTGMGAATHERGWINRGEVAIENGVAIEFDLNG